MPDFQRFTNSKNLSRVQYRIEVRIRTIGISEPLGMRKAKEATEAPTIELNKEKKTNVEKCSRSVECFVSK
jgi:hypothetical protein